MGDAPGAPSAKISACLIEVMEPYREECKSLEAYQRLVSLTSAAWNLSTFPPEEQQDLWERALLTFPPEERLLMESILRRLAARKEELFPHDHRYVASTDVLDEGTHFRVIAATISTGGTSSQP